MRLVLLLLALPLAAQSPVGTWEAETVRVVQGIEVTDHGAITFRCSPAEAAILLMLGQLTETMDSLGAEVAWLAAEEGESEEEG